ncbi:MFS transporter [Corynebacterium yudongzhengii]|uniref:MFS transporter n=1 Tax=Corynebacterium yudongzhengii TaxID=2080740 RepID=A0A2U1T6N7_9CORY|nr:MDR family MFS transporter [Corynebacterium yudongzhengii]AWB82218.1 MFS transporter [Corynebacterium yudongzhengii]PWC01667.1 MFS transporter [Corynebacterium yudongzhengii]
MSQKNAPHVGLVFASLMTTMLMSSLGQMIFSTALPTIVGELGGVEHMSWVISAFLATMTIAMPISGKIGDTVGRKWVYIISIGLFVVGSAIGGFADTMGLLILGRAIQGLGAGSMMINSQAIIAEVTTARERGKFMGLMGSVFGVSSVLGPVLGGWFTDGPGWRWALWMNIPLGLLAILVATLVLNLRTGKARWRDYDYLGTALLSVATATLVLVTTWGGTQYAWTSPLILILGAVSVLAGLAFVWVEMHSKDPLIRMGLFRHRNMLLTTLSGVVIGLAMVGVLAYLPTYLQMVHGLTPTTAGLMMIPMMLGLLGTSTAVGFIVARTGNYKVYPIIGLVLTTVSLVLLSTMTVETPLSVLGIYFFLFGFGLGMVMQILVLIVQNTFPLRVVGQATAANNFFRQIGSALGASLVGSLFIHNIQKEMQHNLPLAAERVGEEGQALVESFATGDGSSHLTPDAVAELPGPLLEAIVNSYNDGLTPIFLMLAPLTFAAALILLPIKRERLRETID